MTDPLLKWSYIIFIIGISLLYMAFLFYEPEEVLIQDIPNLKANEHFQINGKIESINEGDKVAYFKVTQECEVDLMLFKDLDDNFSEIDSGRIIAKGHLMDEDTYVLDSFKIYQE